MSRARHNSSVSKEADRSSSDFSLFLYQFSGRPGMVVISSTSNMQWRVDRENMANTPCASCKAVKDVPFIYQTTPISQQGVNWDLFFSWKFKKRVTVFWIRPDITVYNSTGWTASTEFITRLLRRPFQSNPQLPHVSREISQYRGHCPWGNQETSACLKAWSRGHVTRPDRFRTQQQ